VSETSEFEVRVHDVTLPSLSVVLLPSGSYAPSDVRTNKLVETFDAGRP
jgi:hypothetical protein